MLLVEVGQWKKESSTAVAPCIDPIQQGLIHLPILCPQLLHSNSLLPKYLGIAYWCTRASYLKYLPKPSTTYLGATRYSKLYHQFPFRHLSTACPNSFTEGGNLDSANAAVFILN